MDHGFRMKGKGIPGRVMRIATNLRGGRLDLAENAATYFERATFTDVDLGRQRIHHFVATGATFTHCDFGGARFVSGFLSGTPQASYSDCNFRRADLRDIRTGPARFERCDFREAKLGHWTPDDAEFIDCTFAGLLSNVLFSGRPVPQRSVPGYLDPPRDRNEFRGNDFRKCQFRGIRFGRGIDLDAQALPDGPKYLRVDQMKQRVQRAVQTFATWPNHEEREQALSFLRLLTETPYHGQAELFLAKSDLEPMGRMGVAIINRLQEPLPAEGKSPGASFDEPADSDTARLGLDPSL